MSEFTKGHRSTVERWLEMDPDLPVPSEVAVDFDPAIRALLASHDEGRQQREFKHRANRRIEVLAKWSRRWKQLAQWRGWPASEHEKTRQERGNLKAEVERLKAGQEQRCVTHAAFSAPDSDCVFCDHEAEKERAEAAEACMEAVLALHIPRDISPRYCDACEAFWPCPTVKALRPEPTEDKCWCGRGPGECSDHYNTGGSE